MRALAVKQTKDTVTPPELCWSVPGAVKKKIITARNHSPPLTKVGPR